MPTSCPPMQMCDTHAPGWINGEHPTVADGKVTREVCFHWSSNCCNWSTNIHVQNCGTYYIYYLSGTPGCSFRYCGTDWTSRKLQEPVFSPICLCVNNDIYYAQMVLHWLQNVKANVFLTLRRRFDRRTSVFIGCHLSLQDLHYWHKRHHTVSDRATKNIGSVERRKWSPTANDPQTRKWSSNWTADDPELA